MKNLFSYFCKYLFTDKKSHQYYHDSSVSFFFLYLLMVMDKPIHFYVHYLRSKYRYIKLPTKKKEEKQYFFINN